MAESQKRSYFETTETRLVWWLNVSKVLKYKYILNLVINITNIYNEPAVALHNVLLFVLSKTFQK